MIKLHPFQSDIQFVGPAALLLLPGAFLHCSTTLLTTFFLNLLFCFRSSETSLALEDDIGISFGQLLVQAYLENSMLSFEQILQSIYICGSPSKSVWALRTLA